MDGSFPWRCSDPIFSRPLVFRRFWYYLSINHFVSILLFGSHRFKVIIELDVIYISLVYVFHATLFLFSLIRHQQYVRHLWNSLVACFCLHLICRCLVLGRCGSKRLCFAYRKMALQQVQIFVFAIVLFVILEGGHIVGKVFIIYTWILFGSLQFFLCTNACKQEEEEWIGGPYCKYRSHLYAIWELHVI